MTSHDYDILIIGGGIQGACIAWDAALRGLSVALVEKQDFGHATSANSLKIIHGGLRYLQDGNIPLVRTMIRERTAFMRIAPHLVHPLPCLMPTYGRSVRSRPAMGAALAFNDLVGFDRNRLSDPEKHLPRGRVLSRDECLQFLPGIADRNLTGAALWYDGLMYSSERLTLAFVLSAAEAGADVANYLEASGFLQERGRVAGIRAVDGPTGTELEIRARLVVNAAGPWAGCMLDRLNGQCPATTVHLSTAMNLVTRQVIPLYAAGIPSRGGSGGRSRLLFVVPWHGSSLIGTIHAPYGSQPHDDGRMEEQIESFLDEINAAYPGAALQREDVHRVHSGFLPAEANTRGSNVKLVRQGQIYDHARIDGIDGIISVVGVKYTTARHLAQKTVDLVFEKLGMAAPVCTTQSTPLHGGKMESFGHFLASAVAHPPHGLEAEDMHRLAHSYGWAYTRVAKHLEDEPEEEQALDENTRVVRAEILHGIREEMAQTLADIVFRRTGLGAAEHPGDECLHTCANLMAAELGWSDARKRQELEAVETAFQSLGVHMPLPHSNASRHC